MTIKEWLNKNNYYFKDNGSNIIKFSKIFEVGKREYYFHQNLYYNRNTKSVDFCISGGNLITEQSLKHIKKVLKLTKKDKRKLEKLIKNKKE